MISDYFPPGKRATALSFYSMGIYFGILVGFLMGGYLNQHVGWRTAFFVLGLPGIIFSLFFYSTVKEPQRGATDLNRISAKETRSLTQVLKLLYSKKTFVYLALATGLHSFSTYGLSNWAPSFLARLHGMKTSEIGFSLGLIFGIGGAMGTFVGGFLTDYFGKADKRNYLKIPAYAIFISIPFAAGAIFFKDSTYALVCLSGTAFLYSIFLVPSIAVTHSLVPASLRSISSAILFFVLNLVGLGFGPLVVGIISDLLAPTLGAESLRWAMSTVMVMSVASILLYLLAAKKLAGDLLQKN
jgi:predicted MFS family arabinose efflux permease